MSDALPGGHLSLDAVVAFVDGELPAGPASRAAAHVDRCLSCAGEVAAQRQARRRVRAAGPPSVPTTLLAALRAIPGATEATEATAATDATKAPAGLTADGVADPPSRRSRRRPGLPVMVGSGVVVGAAALAALAGSAAGVGAHTSVPAPRSTAVGPPSTGVVPTETAADLALRRDATPPGPSGPGGP